VAQRQAELDLEAKKQAAKDSRKEKKQGLLSDQSGQKVAPTTRPHRATGEKSTGRPPGGTSETARECAPAHDNQPFTLVQLMG
jgi:hypothetical protein